MRLEQAQLEKRHKMKEGTRCRGQTGRSCGKELGFLHMSRGTQFKALKHRELSKVSDEQALLNMRVLKISLRGNFSRLKAWKFLLTLPLHV